MNAATMNRLMRSVLFVPGTRREWFPAAIESGADVVLFDLEDSVDPSRKEAARVEIEEFLTASSGACLRLIRINPFGSAWFGGDVEFVRRLTTLDGVVLPKAETSAQVAEILRAVAPRIVIPLIETARGILNALTIATAEPPIPALVFGAEDLTAQLGVPRTVDGEEVLFARSQ